MYIFLQVYLFILLLNLLLLFDYYFFYLSWFSMYEARAHWCIFEWSQYIYLVYAEIHFELV
jgi:hypothetical protein